MIAVTGRKISQICRDIEEECGVSHMVERSLSMTLQEKEHIKRLLSEGSAMPDFSFPVGHISYLDGCKVYFENGGWVLARFSGTEPLLRIFCEMPSEADASRICSILEYHLTGKDPGQKS